MVTESMDVTLLPKNVVDLTSFRDLCIIPLKEQITSQLVAVRLKNRKHSELTQAFWDFLLEIHTVVGAKPQTTESIQPINTTNPSNMGKK